MLSKNIKVEEEVWWELNKLKAEMKLKRIADVIENLLKNVNYHDKGGLRKNE